MEDDFETNPGSKLDLKKYCAVILIAFVASGIYVKFFSQPKRDKVVKALESLPGTEVMNRLGKPFKEFDSATFNQKMDALAAKGTPLSNADVTAQGNVWLYKDTTYGYMTVFFDTNNCVTRVSNTYWVEAP